MCPEPSNIVCNEGERVSPYAPCESLASLIGYSTNYCCQNQRHTVNSILRLVVNMFCWGKILLRHSNTWIWYQRCEVARRKHSVPCEATIPVVSLRDLTMGGAFETFTIGSCCDNALGLLQAIRPIPQPNGHGRRLPVSQAPSCIVTKNFLRTGRNPIYGLIYNLSS